MQRNNQRLNPEIMQLRGIEPVSEPVELKIQQTGNRPNLQSESDMLAFAESLNKFANGTLSLDRAARLQAENQAKEIYLKQQSSNKKVWKNLSEEIPAIARFNPYTKDYYNDLVAEKIAQDSIADMQLQYSQQQLSAKEPKDIEEFFAQHKEKLNTALNDEGLSPKNAIKAVESFETAKTAMTKQYIPANAEYNYKRGLGIVREKIVNKLNETDLTYLKPDEKIKTIKSTIQSITDEASQNGVVAEDLAKEVGSSLFNYIANTLDDDGGFLDEAELLQALKEIKIDGRTLNELVPNFDVQIKEFIDKSYEGSISRATRSARLEEAKTKNAYVMACMELSEYMSTLSGEPNSYENSVKIKAKIDEICSKDAYFRRCTGDVYNYAFNTNRTIEAFNSRFANKGKVAEFMTNIALNPSSVDLGQAGDLYRSGEISLEDYNSILSGYSRAKEGQLNTETQLLATQYKEQIEIIRNNQDLDDEFKQQKINEINNAYISAFRQLSNPFQQNPNAFNEYQNTFNTLTKDLDKQNKAFQKQREDDERLKILNTKLDKTKPVAEQGMFKSMTYNYKPYVPVGRKALLADRPENQINVFYANKDVSYLYNQPVSVTSPYGKARSNGKKHGGVDYAPNGGDKAGKNTLVVNVVGKGKVYKGYDKTSGKYVKVNMLKNPDCSYYVMHLNNYVMGLDNGMVVNAYTPLGYMGNTGHVVGSNGSDGTHTHIQFEYKGHTVDEKTWLNYLRNKQ